MAWIFRPRIWFLLVAVACAAMLGYGYYVQHVLFIDPCPLCVLQRLAFIWIGVVSLLAFFHNPAVKGYWVYSGLFMLGALAGSAIAGRHVWLQSLLSEVFYGSGECADINWSFLGLSMPSWSLIWYIGLAIATIVVLVKNSKAKA